MEILRELASLSAKELFALSVLGTIVTVIGNLLATLVKDYFLARSLESWKTRQSLSSIYRGYRDPITMAGLELVKRFCEFTFDVEEDRESYLDPKYLKVCATQMDRNTWDDPYFLNYKLLTTIYRLCALLGWLELYRREVTFLDSGKSKVNRLLENCIDRFRSALADGQLHDEANWLEWHDLLLFRDEQRAIGNTMIAVVEKERCVIGYETFWAIYTGDKEEPKRLWLQKAGNFLLGLSVDKKEKDFRRARCLLMVVSLIDLLELLDKKRVSEGLKKRKERARAELEDYSILKQGESELVGQLWFTLNSLGATVKKYGVAIGRRLRAGRRAA